MRGRLPAIVISLVVLLVAVGLALYVWGTPQAPTAGSASSADVPAPDPNSPLAIEIPGCTCHSDDAELVEEHAQYRMNQCFGCHADGTPEMGS